MSEAKMGADASADFGAPPFRPILTDAADGATFTMLGTTMRLIANAAGTAGRYTVIEQATPPGWGPPRHIHSREDEVFISLTGATSCMSEMSAGSFPLVLPRSYPATFHTAFATWHPRPAVWYSLSFPVD